MTRRASRDFLPYIALVLATTLVSGCIRQAPITPGIANSTPVPELGQTNYIAQVGADYLLRPADKLSVTVFREAELSLPEVTISAEGRISVPLVGPVQAAGMTIENLEQRLEQLYDARYLRSPDIAVNVIEYASHVVTVEGAVEREGLYTFRPGTTLTGAISLAAGPERVADMREVAVFRQTQQGTLIAKFDYAKVRAGTMLDPVIQPGDRVVVGTDNLSQTWQDFLRTIPVLGIFTQF